MQNSMDHDASLEFTCVRYWKSLDHFSMMPFGWIPDDGVEFFKQFIPYLEERWLRLCDLAKDHLAARVSWAEPAPSFG